MSNATPQYIKSLLMPNGKKPRGRRVWSIDLETVWLPFFTATNTMGDTSISPASLGAPLRLAYEQDGSVRFTKTGRPVVRVVKDIADNVRLIRENFTATLQDYSAQVIKSHSEGYKRQIELARKLGEPIVNADRENLDKANAERLEQQLAEGKDAEPAKEPAKEPVLAKS